MKFVFDFVSFIDNLTFKIILHEFALTAEKTVVSSVGIKQKINKRMWVKDVHKKETRFNHLK